MWPKVERKRENTTFKRELQLSFSVCAFHRANKPTEIIIAQGTHKPNPYITYFYNFSCAFLVSQVATALYSSHLEFTAESREQRNKEITRVYDKQ